MKRFLPLIIFSVMVAFLAIGLKLNPRDVSSPLIDKPVPKFTLPLLKGAGRSFSPSELRGQVWVLNVWASWCVACRSEHPVLNHMVKQNSDIILVGLNYKDQKTDALAWLNNFGDPYRYTVVDSDGRVGIDWGVYGVPESFIVDKQGIIRYKHTGPVDTEAVTNVLLPLIRKLSEEKI